MMALVKLKEAEEKSLICTATRDKLKNDLRTGGIPIILRDGCERKKF
jgi:hypothetical protein